MKIIIINKGLCGVRIYKHRYTVLYIESSGGEHINANKHKYKCKMK